jgi:Flp pilus assembly protein TadG
MLEFMFTFTMLMVIMFGLIDFGRAIYTRQILVNLTREAANLASRGTTLSNTVVAVKTSAQPLNIDQNGYVILTVVFRNQDNSVTVTNQLKSGGVPATSHVGAGGVGSTPVLPVTPDLLPPRNQTLYAAEVFYRFIPVTPVGKLLHLTMLDALYDVAYF